MTGIWWNLKWKIPTNSLEFRSVEVSSYSWISDLIPKKSEKFEFRKIFWPYFQALKIDPGKRNFDILCAFCKKVLKETQTGISTRIMSILKNLFFHRNQRKIQTMSNQRLGIFSHESIVMSMFYFLAISNFWAGYFREKSFWDFKSSLDQSPFTFEIIVGKSRIRHTRTLQSNFFSKSIEKN